MPAAVDVDVDVVTEASTARHFSLPSPWSPSTSLQQPVAFVLVSQYLTCLLAGKSLLRTWQSNNSRQGLHEAIPGSPCV